MERATCQPEENVVRAIPEAHYDGKRVASSLFKGSNKSVSRLDIMELSEIVKIFLQELNTPRSTLLATGEINVGKLQNIGNMHSEPVVLTVEIDPTPSNPAHAEIPQKISKSVARKICDVLKISPL